jgi:hypothetical protein
VLFGPVSSATPGGDRFLNYVMVIFATAMLLAAWYRHLFWPAEKRVGMLTLLGFTAAMI